MLKKFEPKSFKMSRQLFFITINHLYCDIIINSLTEKIKYCALDIIHTLTLHFITRTNLLTDGARIVPLKALRAAKPFSFFTYGWELDL